MNKLTYHRVPNEVRPIKFSNIRPEPFKCCQFVFTALKDKRIRISTFLGSAHDRPLSHFEEFSKVILSKLNGSIQKKSPSSHNRKTGRNRTNSSRIDQTYAFPDQVTWAFIAALAGLVGIGVKRD